MSHFTQVVWKSTTQLGCGIASCPGLFGESRGTATYHVCLYDPVGNVVGEEKSVCSLCVIASSDTDLAATETTSQSTDRGILVRYGQVPSHSCPFARSDSPLLPRSGTRFHGLFIASTPGVVGASLLRGPDVMHVRHSRSYAAPFYMVYL